MLGYEEEILVVAPRVDDDAAVELEDGQVADAVREGPPEGRRDLAVVEARARLLADEEGGAVVAVALDEAGRVLAALEEAVGDVGLVVHLAAAAGLGDGGQEGLEELAEALLGVFGYRGALPLRYHCLVLEAVELAHRDARLHAHHNRDDPLLVDLGLGGEPLEALALRELGSAELEDEGYGQGEGCRGVAPLGYAQVGMGRHQGGDLLQVDAPAGVVEVEEDGLDQEGEVGTSIPRSPIASKPLAALPEVAPVLVPAAELPR